jgi:signal transduction histidine kinase/DNA-binding NarL/FixJ family response regulator
MIQIRAITEGASRSMEVARTGVWLFREGKSSLEALDLFDSVLRLHSDGMKLRAAEYPEYFAALDTERVIAAHDAWEHPATRCFAEGCLRPQGITSLLDAPVRVDGIVVGVLCLEHVGPRRRWSDEEQIAAGNLADFVSLAIEGHKRRNAEEALRKSKEDLARAQKLDALGRLASGVAHDTNNFLTIILGHAELIRRKLPAESPLASQIEQVQWAAEQASTVTRQLLASGRGQLSQSSVVELSSVIDSMQPILQTALGERITFDFRCGQGLGRIKIDQGRMEQILLNLVVNARDAMPRGGDLSITARNESVLKNQCSEWVVLEVTDSGTGIEPSVQERMFEPFYTTKEPGKGTGLGLSIVRDFVVESGGEISVRSATGQGTTFVLRFPRLKEQVTTVSRAERPEARESTPDGKCVLIVEDQPELSLLAKASLESYGYSVLVARDIDEAVSCSLSHPGLIDLVLSDVVMPGASGPAVVRALQKLRPNVKVLFTSGYGSEDLELLNKEPLPPPILEKPYSPDTLARAVDAALASEARWAPLPEGEETGAPPSAQRPEIRASYFKALIAGVNQLPEPHRSDILRAAEGWLRLRIRQAALLDWMPAETFVMLTDAIDASLGASGAIAFWKASMHASLQRAFLAPLRIAAIRTYGKNPGSLIRMTPRAWRMLAQGCGGSEIEMPTPSSVLQRFTRLPTPLRRRSLLHVWAGGCQACIEEVGFQGTASIRDERLDQGVAEILVDWTS